MSSELYCTMATITGITRRSIPILHRFSSATITVPSGGGTLVTTDTVNNNQSRGNTGFTYSNGRYTNNSGTELVVLVSYGLIWSNDFNGSRMSWVQLDNNFQRYAMCNFQSVALEPSISASAVIVVPNNSFLRLWVFQQSGSNRTLLTTYDMPYFNICVI